MISSTVYFPLPPQPNSADTVKTADIIITALNNLRHFIASGQRFAALGAELRRLCLIHLKNDADTEDIFQTVFLKYALSSAAFESDEHEKAWLIRVTINACKDLLKSLFHRRTVPLDEILEQPTEMREDHKEVLEAVLSLPQKYREVVYLHYYEGYTAPEVGKILGKKANTVYTLLTRSRQLLRKKLGGDEDG